MSAKRSEFAQSVVGIGVPKVAPDKLGDALRDLSPEILSFFISFVVIGFYWRGHHRFVARLGAIDDGLIMLNLAVPGHVDIDGPL